MSRIGKKQIVIPENIDIKIYENTLSVSGKHGSLERNFLNYVSIVADGKVINVHRNFSSKAAQAYYGLAGALISNMVQGVSIGFRKGLIAEGVGYKFQLEGSCLSLFVGFSHIVTMQIPTNVYAKLESPTKIVLSGANKEKIGLFAAQIRNTRPPEPYKGKGIRYEGEKIVLKAGKTKK